MHLSFRQKCFVHPPSNKSCVFKPYNDLNLNIKMVHLERDKKAALVSIVVTAFLAVIKYSIGIISGSIALIADAIHSLTGVISSIGVFMGLKIHIYRAGDRNKP